jgi:hypothetical protein
MKIVTVTRYQALDGEMFDSEAECRGHEYSKRYEYFIHKIISEYDVASKTDEIMILEFLNQNREQIVEFCKNL